MRSIIDRLRTARELAELSQSDLSRLCGLRRTYFSQLERLLTDIGVSRLVAAIVVLGLPLEWLVLGQGDPPREADVRAAVERARRDPRAVTRAIGDALGVQPKPEPHHPRPRPRRRLAARPKPLRPTPTPEARPS